MQKGSKAPPVLTGATCTPIGKTSMNISVAAPLAQALASKGYETLTPVQTAMLEDGVAGRDLLVSAQTGSGKTVAFGLAIAPEVLGGQEKLLYADKPLALVVAPTRELALQVRREFEWLYAEAGASLASCVGGMDYRTEKRALDRGAHIVVGTPGRLRDHIERNSLDLSQCRAVILDEADEMLDLGFAEDLGFILSAAPPERRTLMFSATVPKEIAELAQTFQTDALRIVAGGEAKQHVDIAYRALSVAVRDREHAIFNALRFYEAQTAIVFCKTRANVNHLLARMGNRGFQVVALSGELSQQERTHALQALRDGRARVCIATDVAARGIDLPGLELVIHADLPSNSETLLHRSGRTGRAGAKGTSVLIVPPAEFRKAQRLLQGAKVVAEWGPPPSAEEVQAKDDARLLSHPALVQGPGEEGALVAALLAEHGPQNVAAAFVRLWREGRSAPEVLSDAAPTPAPSAPRERGDFGPSVWFALSVGHEGRAEARWILPKICDAGGIAKDSIGAIRVQTNETFVQLAAAVASRFGDTLELEPGLTLRRLPGEPNLDRPERTPVPRKPAARAEKPAYRKDEGDAPRAKPTYTPKPPRVVEEDDAPPPAAASPRPIDPPAPRREARRADTPWSPDDAPAKKPRWKADAADAPRPPRSAPDANRAPRSAGFKSHGGPAGDRPARAAGFKSHSGKPAGDGARPYTPRGDGDRPARPAGAKPYAPRTEGDRPAKPYAAKPYAPRGDGDHPAKPYRAKTYTPRADGDRPSPKPDGERPPRAAGFKSNGGAGKPGAKPGAKSWAKPGPKPAPKPPVDPRDTSKRFVPPKKPKA